MEAILARLNAKTSSWGNAGGFDSLTASQIAAACAGANPLGLDLLLASICQNRGSQIKAFYAIYLGIVDIALKSKWKMREREDRLRSLAQLAIFEATNDQACPRCKGTQYDPKRPSVSCTPCRGTGRYRIKDYQRAKALGVSDSVWCNVWKLRYRDIEIYIDEQKYEALSSIRQRLFS